ncbi:membrane-bound lytic murein transglycosylase MltF [bacterium]|nr:membrane-bound lytic murein transglycosylase MltF [bacterium]
MRILPFILIIALFMGCNKKSETTIQSSENSTQKTVLQQNSESKEKKPQEESLKNKTEPKDSQKNEKPKIVEYVEKGDLTALKERKRIRIIVPPKKDADFLPRAGSLANQEYELIKDFAKEQGLKTQRVYASKFDDMVQLLLEGKGDIIAANLTITDERKEKIGFSAALTTIKEFLIGKSDKAIISKKEDLKGLKIAVRKSSSYFKTVTDLQKEVENLEIIEVPDNLDTEQIIHKVSKGEYDYTVCDSNLFDSITKYRDDVKPLFTLAENKSIAWGLRPDSIELKKELDNFITVNHVDLWAPRTFKDDLSGLKKRKVLRFITRNNSTTYFLYRGQLMGFEYELAKEFAKQQGLRLEVIIPPTRQAMFDYLKEGKGDIIGASVTITDTPIEGIAFGKKYNKVSELLITRADDNTLNKPEDLKGRKVVVRKSSSYWKTLEKLKSEGVEFELIAAPEGMETEEIVKKVALGEYDLTLADSHIVMIEMTLSDKIKSAFPLGDEREHGWVVRAENKELLEAIDNFFKKEYKGLIYNITYNKYFKNQRRIQKISAQRSDKTGSISPYDELVKKYAKKYNFDWVLMSAQMYKESQFNPNAKSWVGALGLMQVMPQTGKELGFDDLVDPEKGIHAGVKYMSRMRKKFSEELPAKDRVWFALASYNCGYGHVLDARRIAEMEGLNPNKWFGNVEKAMLLLSVPKYSKKARYGYCRCEEPVDYVSKIKTYYEAYMKNIPQDEKTDKSIDDSIEDK